MLISVEEEVISHISFIAFIHYFSYLPSERGVGQSLLELLYQNPNENCSLVPGDAATLAPLAAPNMACGSTPVQDHEARGIVVDDTLTLPCSSLAALPSVPEAAVFSPLPST